MSTTQMLTGNLLTEKKWALKGWQNVGMNSAFGLAAQNGIIYFADDLIGQTARGDEITYSYLNPLTGVPKGEGDTLDGNEEAMDLGNFKIAVNVTRIGVSNPNDDTIEQQRTKINFGEKGNKLIMNRHIALLDTAFFYHAAGANPTSFTLNGTTWSGTDKKFVQAHNTPVAPSTNRVLRANAAATDQALTSADTFSLDLIDYALEKNARSDQPIEKLDDGCYHLFLSPEQATALKKDSAGKNQWYMNQLAMMEGGKDNQMMSTRYSNSNVSYMGQWQDVKIFQASRVAYGLRSDTSAVITTVRRAVLCGKDAVTFASPFGSSLSDKNVPLKFKAQLKDFDYYKGIEGRFIGGMKKNTPSNGEDIGVMAISTYAAASA